MSARHATTESDELLFVIRAAAGARGLNLVGVVDAADYDAAAPEGNRLTDAWPSTRSALVIGNAGPVFWGHFRERFGGDPSRTKQEHPLDAFTVEAVAPVRRVLREGGFGERAAFPFFGARDHALSFRRLAVAAGFGADSVLGLVLHPEFGPWIATRAAILTDGPFRPSRPMDDFDPCAGCPAPCISVCPGQAFPDRRWSFSVCLTAKRTLDPCRNSCLSRIHCVFGTDYRYSAEEMSYHSTLPWAEARREPPGRTGRAGGPGGSSGGG